MPRLAKNQLELTRRKGSEAWYIRGTLRRNGFERSCFESSGTADRNEAEKRREAVEKELWKQLMDEQVNGPVVPVFTFAHAVDSYLERNSGASPTTLRHVERLLNYLADTPLEQIDQNTVDACCRPSAGLITAKAGNATKLRAVQTPLLVILRHANRRKMLATVPQFEEFRIPRPTTTIILPEQATALVRNSAHHLRPLVATLLGTGCRCSEILELTWQQVDLRGRQATVWQKDNNGAPRERLVRLEPVVIQALESLPHRDGIVFRPARHNSFELAEEGYRSTNRTGGGQFKTAFGNAAGRAGLPGRWLERKRPDRPSLNQRFMSEFTQHDCRHTWASWQYALHKDLMKLQYEGGWLSSSSCQRYTHRCPDEYRGEIRDWLDGAVNLGLGEVRERKGKPKPSRSKALEAAK